MLLQVSQKSKAMIVNTGKEQTSSKYLDSRYHSEELPQNLTDKNNLPDSKSISTSFHCSEMDSFIRQHLPISENLPIIDYLLAKLNHQHLNTEIKNEIFKFLESLTEHSLQIDTDFFKKIISFLEKHNNTDLISIDELKNLLLELKHILLKPATALYLRFSELPIDSMPGGIFKLDSFKKYINSLDISDLNISNFEQFLQSSNEKYVRIIPFCGNSLATLISHEDLCNELKSIIDNFSSQPFRSLSSHTLKAVIESHMFLDLDSLNSIDLLVANTKKPWCHERSGSKSAQQSVLNQWLCTTLDNESNTSQMVSRFPETTTSVISTIKNVPSLVPSADYYGITEEMISNAKNKADIIPSILERLGFNYESQIFKCHEQTNRHNLKAVILKNLFDSESEISHLNSAVSNKNAEFLYNRQNISSQIATLLSDISEITDTIPAKISSNPDCIKTMKSIQNFTFELSKLIKNPNFSLQNSGDSFVNHLTKISNELKLLSGNIEMNQSGISFDITEHLLKLTDEITQSVKNIIQQEFDMEGNRKSTINENYQISIEKDIIDDVKINTQTNKNLMETLLNRVESLQLLAKTTSISTETDQQILALPINIGGEWTEVNIRLLKKQNKQKRIKKKNIFAVQINVAPLKLGAISVRMEYEANKKLQLKLNFEKKDTLEYFSKYLSDIKISLENLGFLLVKMQLQVNIPNIDNDPLVHANGSIDFKI